MTVGELRLILNRINDDLPVIVLTETVREEWTAVRAYDSNLGLVLVIDHDGCF